MSLNERARLARSPSSALAPGFIGISRSKSFTGPLCQKRPHGSSQSLGPGSISGSEFGRSTWTMPVLGENFKNNSFAWRIYQGTARLKTGKVPRPVRTAVIFESVAQGLRECISVTEEDINNLRQNIADFSLTREQQLKAAERYLKRLEYQLTKVEELQENYEMQQKLREGVRSMAYAYVLSPGKKKEAALTSVKSGYKECTEMMCNIEDHLQRMMGTLLFQMRGVQGFARVCPGDVFEINLKYGQQKWRTKGRVLKNSQQAWDTPRVLFKALLGEVLHVKACEVKGLGKTVLLGSKYCETKDLFSAHPQVMTLNLNPSGSLKLSVVITWNPLDGSVEEMSGGVQLLPIGTSPAAPRKRSLPNHQHSFSNSSNGYHSAHSSTTGSSYSSDSLRSPNGDSASSAGSTPDVEYPNNRLSISNKQPSNDSGRHSWYGRNTVDLSFSDRCGNGVEVMERSQTVDNGDCRHLKRLSYHKLAQESVILDQGSSPTSKDLCYSMKKLNIHHSGIQEALQSLICALEDIRGQYPELHKLERRAIELEKLLRKNNNSGSQSDISVSVESALECFDFLNTEDDEDDDRCDNRIHAESGKMDRDLTAKTNDSGISSIARQLCEDRGSSPESGGGPSPVPLSTDHEQLDTVLLVHINQCKSLVENLGSFGPLRCKEEKSIEKLRRQAYVLQRVLKISRMPKQKKAALTGPDELRDNQLQTLWQHCTPHEDDLYVSADTALERLVQAYRTRWERNNTGLTRKVMQLLLCRTVDVHKIRTDQLLTIYDLINYFYFVEQGNIDRHLDDLAREVSLVERLHSGDIQIIAHTFRQMSATLPPLDCLKVIDELLINENKEVRRQAAAYLREINNIPALRKQVIMVFLEVLEEDSPRIRLGACIALSQLEALECIDQLAYVSQTDRISDVRMAAKEALLSLGDEGRRAFDQCQLASHGFHGLGIN